MRVLDHTVNASSATAPAPSLTEAGARALLKALADPLRLQVLEALGDGERCVCDLGGDLGLAQSKLSFHLKVMREAGLLAARDQGRWTYYRLQPEAIGALQQWLDRLVVHSQRPAPACPD
ncbi:helix-turn-helix transcriptional regulator [Cyanobium sp. NIES-981]|uniref:ArsR/SmtB family transcription factor n=1 Tax=Cyanobium sp. NIES-981 TaxID=1851505 RepID=UPI0007DD0E4E|nr:metalloregulator ArsR/SmtB family transcription factor [Cyanobium sp. NIES-981]SBO42778.1 Bacterial regulatory protein, ArsR family [Cyanobium sp. NIES-981]